MSSQMYGSGREDGRRGGGRGRVTLISVKSVVKF